MTIYEEDINKFLNEAGWADAKRSNLSGDASFRSYERLNLNAEKAVLMLAPPQKENTIPFIAVAEHLTSLGYSAPKIIAKNTTVGLLLLEDFGDNLLNKFLELHPENELEYYTLAIDLLVNLQASPLPKTLSHSHILPTYDKELLLNEVGLFSNWYMSEILETNNNLAKEWQSLWQILFEKLEKPSVLTLRDYHAENIIFLKEREYIKKIGLLDFQDAVVGYRAYDLVSLLEDARRMVPPELESKMLQHFINATKKQGINLDDTAFIEEYNILGAQRNAKIIGIFTRLWKRDGKDNFPEMIPHVWQMLERNLRHPSLEPIKQWLDKAVPSERRFQPLKAK